MNNLLSINNSAERCKQEGIPLSEKAIRQFVKSGEIPAVFTGKKALIYFPNIVEFIKNGNTRTMQLEQLQGKIRAVGARR